jgi:IclR family pca regulon transcriptional regulator
MLGVDRTLKACLALLCSQTEHEREPKMGAGSADFVQSLERGLSVIRAFDGEHQELTLSEVAVRTGLTRAAARRFLLTLEAAGYARLNDRRFQLTPRVMELGHAYLSSLTIPEIAMPHLERLAAEVGAASSVSVLDGKDIVYVARATTRRIMSVNINVGTRFPAVSTAMGRAMLACLPPNELDEFLKDVKFTAFTDKTITDVGELRTELDRVRKLGYCLLDQELEIGLRALAVALRDRSGHPLAALNISIPGAVGTVKQIISAHIGPLSEHARAIENDVHAVGSTSRQVVA